jgi:hypothetical protein
MAHLPGLSLSVTAAPNFPTHPNSRVAALERERPKLTLAPRTLPRELPPAENYREEEDRRLKQLRKSKKVAADRKKQQEAKKKALLAAAFNSDSEAEDKGRGNDSDDVWALSDAEFSDSD